MIVVDSREPSEFRIVGDIVRKLEFGDYDIMTRDYLHNLSEIDMNKGYHHYVLERKTPTDFWQSLKNGRLNKELSGSQAMILDCHEHGTDLSKYFDQKYVSKDFSIDRVWDCINGVATHHTVYITTDILMLGNMLRRFEEKKVKGIFGRMTT
jgi:hypothetical protein